MRVVERFFAHGYEFAFVAGGAARFGKPGDGRWPEYVLVAFEYALDVGLEGIVIIDGYVFLKIGDAVYLVEFVFFAVFCKLCRADKVVEYLLLGINRVVHEIIYCALAQLDETFECRTDDAQLLMVNLLKS